MSVPEGFKIRKFDDTDVYVTTLPKGTVLYRGVKSMDSVRYDIWGVPTKDGRYCLTPNYNVFFYPFPFVDVTVEKYTHLLVYVVANDITLATFISPSPALRSDRHEGTGPILTCSEIPEAEFGCKLVGQDYDPCFKPEFRTAHPDVSGMIGIADMDRDEFMTNITNYKQKSKVRTHLNKYLTTYVDATGKPGVPEVILYPFTTRPTDPVYTPGTTIITEWYTANRETVSYFTWHTMERTDAGIESFLETATTTGHHGTRLRLDTRTGFYVAESFADDETKKHLVDVKIGTEWTMSQDPTSEFRFKKQMITPKTEMSDDEYNKRLYAVSDAIANEIRTKSPGRTKYADRLAYALAEIVLRVMMTAAGYYRDNRSNEYLCPEDYTKQVTTFDECREVITDALATLDKAPKGHPVAPGEFGLRTTGYVYVGDITSSSVSDMFDEEHARVMNALLDASYVPDSKTYDRTKMIDTAATLANHLLKETIWNLYEALADTYTEIYATEVTLDHLAAVESLLTEPESYGDDGWVNDAFDRRFQAPLKGKTGFGDWTDEKSGGKRHRTYRTRRTSLRRRR